MTSLRADRVRLGPMRNNEQRILRKLCLLAMCAAVATPGTAFGATAHAGKAAAAVAPAPASANNSGKDDPLNQIFALQEKVQSQESIDKVMKCLEEGGKAMQAKDFEKAINKFQEAYGQSLEMKYGDGEGRALVAMCNFYTVRGQLVKAKQLGENAIEILSEQTDKRPLGYARVQLAQVYLGMDNAYMALQQLELAMQCFSEAGNNDGGQAGQAMVLAAGLAVKANKIKEAMQFYEAAAAYFGQSGRIPEQLTIEISLSNMMLEMGLTRAANEEALKALTVARQAKDPGLLVAALSLLANCQYALGEYAQARKTYEEVLSTKLEKQMPLAIATLEEGYSFTLAATGDYAQAKTYMDKALAVIKAQGTAYHKTQLLNALGVLESQSGHYPQAIACFKEALDLQPIIQPRQDRLVTVIMQNLGAAEARSGQNRSAKNNYLEAANACQNKKFSDQRLFGRTCAALGEVSLNLKELEQAEQYLRRGIEISSKISDDAALWRQYTLLARLQALLGQAPNEALTSAVSYFRSPQAGSFASPDKLIYPTSREDMGRELVLQLVSADMVEQGLAIAEQLKDESFTLEWQRRGGEVRPADRDIYNDLVAQRVHLHAAESTSTPDKLTKDWQQWLTRFRALAAENQQLARLVAPVPISIDEIAHSVRDNQTTFVDYLVGEKSTIVFTLDGSGKLSAYRIAVDKAQLQQQVASLLTASAKNDEAARAAEKRVLQLLYSELLPDDALKTLPQNPDRTVVVVPDSILFNLPFAALVTPQGRYFVEQHTLTMAPSMSVFLDSPPRHASDISVLIGSSSAPNTQPPAAEATEASEISGAMAGELVKLTGKDVQLDNLQEQAKSTAVIHFHANLNLPENNALALPLPVATSDAGQAKTQVPANRLFELNLPSDLAVWSATAVNAKDVQGRGVQVFTRGLNYAGVRNVMMSLWVAPDPSRTSQLVEFYKGRQMGLSQAQSLRKAQLLALSKDPSPRSWAAFQLIGPGN